jgi:flagellar hook-associated protein 2
MSISSTSLSTSTFNFDGIVSGLKTSDIIDKLMSLEQGPLNQLKAQQVDRQARDDAYQAIDARVADFQTALNKLLIPSNVNAKAVASSTTTTATATASSAATNGTYQLNVTRLATASSVSGSVFDAGQSKWVVAPMGAGLKDGTESGTPKTMLANAGFATAPTSGSLTVNGVQVTIDANAQSLDDVLTAINTALSGSVRASVVNDANGNKNFIKLESLDGKPIMLGSGSDTSNFLSAAHLVSTGDASDLVSSVPLGTVNTSATLSSLNFSTPLAATSGSFNVNGKTISWDAAKDTVGSILSKINSSGAGVSAVYDPTTDSVSMTNIATGSQSIDLDPAHDSGGLLAALHLTGGAAQQKLGQTAQFSINGGPTQFSNSNKVSNVLPGVAITLAGTGSTSLTVSQDSDTTVKNVQGFVSAFNDLVDLIDKDTAYDSTKKQAAVLTGDSAITGLEAQLRRFLTSAVPGLQGTYTTLASLGISTGAFGAAVGSTSHLTLDSNKLTQALQTDPSAVLKVLVGDPTVTVNPGPGGTSTPGAWLSNVSGIPSNPIHGRYQVSVDASGNLTSVFTPVGGGPLSPITGSITAGGSNSSLIPGLVLSTNGLPTFGTRTDALSFGQSGLLSGLSDYLTSVLGKGGIFESQHSAANTDLKTLTDQITSANTVLAQKQQTLQDQFTAMEVALTQLQSQSSSLAGSLASLSGSSSSSK